MPLRKPSETRLQDTREAKTVLRKTMRALLKDLSDRSERSEKLCAALVAHPAWSRASRVAIFAPMNYEPDVELLWSVAVGKTLCYPAVREEQIAFVGVSDRESLVVGQWGIREPVFESAGIIPSVDLDLVLVPGAAFTKDGQRLGRGGGFYDRLLSTAGFRACKIGVCFDQQLVPEVPVEPHDQRVDCVATESGIHSR